MPYHSNSPLFPIFLSSQLPIFPLYPLAAGGMFLFILFSNLDIFAYLWYCREMKNSSLDMLKEMYWDYDYPASGNDIYRFILGEKELDYLVRDVVIARMLVYIRWYDLIDIFGLNKLKSLLNDNVFQYIHNKEMRENYEYVKKVLDRIL
jgi:hypothetical protein